MMPPHTKRCAEPRHSSLAAVFEGVHINAADATNLRKAQGFATLG